MLVSSPYESDLLAQGRMARPERNKNPMADFMGDKIRELLDDLAPLPKADDESAIDKLEVELLDRMADIGIERRDIEEQLGHIRYLIRSEILRRST